MTSRWKTPDEEIGCAAFNPATGNFFMHNGRMTWANSGGVKSALRSFWHSRVRFNWRLDSRWLEVYNDGAWMKYADEITSQDETLTSILPYLRGWASQIEKIDHMNSLRELENTVITAWLSHFVYRKVRLTPIEL